MSPCPTGQVAARPAWQRIVGILLAAAALAYLAHLVANDVDSFSVVLRSQRPGTLFAAIAVAVAMFAIKAIYHATLCQRLSGKTGLLGYVLPAYAVAQVIRYLPGKIWGIIYQSGRLSCLLQPSVVVAANASQTLMTNLLGAGIIASVLCSVHLESAWPLCGIPVAIAFTELLHRHPKLEAWLLEVISRILRRRIEAPDIPALKISGTLMLSLEWVAYYIIWSAILGEGVPSYSTIVIATWYAAASLLAMFAVVVPAGIAVREALFVSMVTIADSNASELIGYAALMRAILTVSEVALIPIAHLFAEVARRSRGQSA